LLKQYISLVFTKYD